MQVCRHKMLVLLIAVVAPTTHVYADSFKAVKRHRLDNGVEVFLAPNTASRNIIASFHYVTGTETENESNRGITHVVEHALFRDASLGANMSYAELIRDAGGSANGETDRWETMFYAQINGSQTSWLIDTFAKMLLRRRITEDMLQKSKREVLLEIGEAKTPLQNAFEALLPYHFPKPDFWTTELNLKARVDTLEAERLNTEYLTTEQANTYYRKYFSPRNLTIVVAGSFDADKVSKQLRDTFGKVKVSNKTPLQRPEEPKATKRAYRYATRGDDHGRIALGLKLENITAAEEVALTAYLDHYAYRLLKEVRNKKGDTYTPSAQVVTYKRSGYAVVDLETTRDTHAAYLKDIRNQMRREAALGKLDNQVYRDMRQFYRNSMSDEVTDAKSMHDIALQARRFYQDYGETRTPTEIINDLKLKGLRETLRKVFAKNWPYQRTEEPPLFSKDEHLVLIGVLVFFLVSLTGRLLRSKFQHTKVRYLRKVRHAPLSIGKVMFGAFVIATNAAWLESVYLEALRTYALDSKMILNYYGPICVYLVLFVPAVMLLMAIVPDKVLIVGDNLVIKHKCLRAINLPLNTIAGVESMRPLQALRRASLKNHFYHWGIWRKGVLITTNTGQKVYLAFADAERVADEINGFRDTAKPTIDQSLEVFESFSEAA